LHKRHEALACSLKVLRDALVVDADQLGARVVAEEPGDQALPLEDLQNHCLLGDKIVPQLSAAVQHDQEVLSQLDLNDGLLACRGREPHLLIPGGVSLLCEEVQVTCTLYEDGCGEGVHLDELYSTSVVLL